MSEIEKNEQPENASATAEKEPEITKIQINFAGFDELMKLHGVGGGPLAQRIITFRENFGNLEQGDLSNLKNLKQSPQLLEQLDFKENPSFIKRAQPPPETTDTVQSDHDKKSHEEGEVQQTQEVHPPKPVFTSFRQEREREYRGYDNREKYDGLPYDRPLNTSPPRDYRLRDDRPLNESPKRRGYRTTFGETVDRVDRLIKPRQEKISWSYRGGARPKYDSKYDQNYHRHSSRYYHESDSDSESEYDEWQARSANTRRSKMGMGINTGINPYMQNPYMMNPYMMNPFMNPYMMDPSIGYAGPHYREGRESRSRRWSKRGRVPDYYQHDDREMPPRRRERETNPRDREGEQPQTQGEREQRRETRPRQQNPRPQENREQPPSPDRNPRVEIIDSDPTDDDRDDHSDDGHANDDVRHDGARQQNRNFRQNRPERDMLPKSLQYDGKDNWDAFSVKFRRYAEVHDWTPRNCKDQLCFCLKGKASEFYATMIKRDATITYEELMQKLQKRFGIKEIPETARVKFNSLKQAQDESIEDWADRVLQLSIHAFPDLPDNYVNSQVIQRICHGAYDRDAGQFAANQPQVNVEATLDKIKSYQYNHKAIFERGHYNKVVREVRTVDISSGEEIESDTSPVRVRQTARGTSRQSQPQNSGYTQGNSGYVSYKAKFEGLEKEMGNIRSDIKCMVDTMERLMRSRSPRFESRSPNRSVSPSMKGCFHCGSENHFKRDCPGLFGQNKSAPGQGPGKRSVHFQERSQLPNRPGSSDRA